MSKEYLHGIREALTKNATKTSLAKLEKQGLQSVRIIRAGRILELIEQSVDRNLRELGVDLSQEQRQGVVDKSHDTLNELMKREKASEDALRKALEKSADLERQVHETEEKHAQAAQEHEGALESLNQECEGLRQKLEAVETELEAGRETQARVDELSTRCEELTTQRDELTASLDEARQAEQEARESLDAARETDDDLAQRLEAETAALQEQTDRCAQLEEELEALRQELNELKRELSEAEELRGVCQSLEHQLSMTTASLREGEGLQKMLDERERELAEERGRRVQLEEQVRNKGDEQPPEVVSALFEEIRGLKESLGSGGGGAPAQPASEEEAPADAALLNLTKNLAERLDQIGRKVGVGAVEDPEIELNKIFSEDLSKSMTSNLDNLQVKERSGGSVTDALARMKALKQGSRKPGAKDD